MPTSLSLRSRTTWYWLAWILWVVSLASPGSGGHSSASVYVLAAIMEPAKYLVPGTRSAGLAHAVFSLALFSNIVLLVAVAVRQARRMSIGVVLLFTGAVVADLAVAPVLPPFARMPGYWLWVIAMGTMAFALIALPYEAAAEPAPVRGRGTRQAAGAAIGTVPFIIWLWLACYVLLLVGFVASMGRPAAPGAPAPKHETSLRPLSAYVTDDAGLLSQACTERVTKALAEFEKETSNQIAVAIYGSPLAEPLEQASIALAEASRLGRKGLDNGAILVVFPASGLARIEVGYGLEGALNDAKAGEILHQALAPAWQRGDHDQAIEATLAGMLNAVRTEYRGGRMPGRVAIFRRQVAVAVPQIVDAMRPALGIFDAGTRIFLAFIGAIFVSGFWDGFRQSIRLVRALAVWGRNLATGRKGMFGGSRAVSKVEVGSLVDSLKIIMFVGFFIAVLTGMVVIAGGGAFGGGGANVRW
jgi:uncharacterized protein